MKIVFSRKGFDSSRASGGCASPIFDDGTFRSLPIPEPRDSLRYHDIQERLVGQLVSDLTGSRLSPDDFVHLDPDLRHSDSQRHSEWRPLFGQCGAAQAHLANCKVDVGDVFLFFGWFRNVQKGKEDKYRFCPNARDIHMLFGWLEIGRRISPQEGKVDAWVQDHPHARQSYGRRKNVIYEAGGIRVPDPSLV